MAKRRKRYGTMEFPKSSQAASSLRVMRGNLHRARASLRENDCAEAIKALTKASMQYGSYKTMKRVAGRAVSHRQDMASVAPYETLEKLREAITQKCVR